MSRILSFRIHYTWIPVFVLVTVILATQFSEGYSFWQRIALGFAASLGYLLAVAVRELFLGMAVLPRETPVRKTLLFAFGGLYDEVRENLVDSYQPLLYLARFSANLLLAVIFYGLYATFIAIDSQMLAGLAQWLAYIFFLVFLLHFIPAFPLDGGRILRTALWRSSGDYYRATHNAGFIGMAVGLFMIFAGVLVLIVTRDWMASLTIVCIGWILQTAAGIARRQARMHMVLQNIKVQDIMTREYPVMPSQTDLGQLVREHILVKGWPYMLVADGAHLKGMLTMEQIKSVPWRNWHNTAIEDIMIPSEKLRTAQLQQSADTLLEDMRHRGIDYIPVLEGENLVGVVNRVALQSLVKTRIGFGA